MFGFLGDFDIVQQQAAQGNKTEENDADKGSEGASSSTGPALPGFGSFWNVAKAVQSAVQQTADEVVRSVQQTDWKNELSAFTHEVEAEAHKAVEAVQHIPTQLQHTRDSESGSSPKEAASRAIAGQPFGAVGSSLAEFGKQLISGTKEVLDTVTDLVEGELNTAAREVPQFAAGSRGGSRSGSRSEAATRLATRQRFATRYSRFEAEVAAMQRDSATYCDEPEDAEDFAAWRGSSFSMDKVQPEVDKILQGNAFMSELQSRLVPLLVEKEDFWARYFYRLHKLQQKEEQRQQLAARAKQLDDQDDLGGWDDDDSPKLTVPQQATPRQQPQQQQQSEQQDEGQQGQEHPAETDEQQQQQVGVHGTTAEAELEADTPPTGLLQQQQQQPQQHEEAVDLDATSDSRGQEASPDPQSAGDNSDPAAAISQAEALNSASPSPDNAAHTAASNSSSKQATEAAGAASSKGATAASSTIAAATAAAAAVVHRKLSDDSSLPSTPVQIGSDVSDATPATDTVSESSTATAGGQAAAAPWTLVAGSGSSGGAPKPQEVVAVAAKAPAAASGSSAGDSSSSSSPIAQKQQHAQSTSPASAVEPAPVPAATKPAADVDAAPAIAAAPAVQKAATAAAAAATAGDDDGEDDDWGDDADEAAATALGTKTATAATAAALHAEEADDDWGNWE